MKMLPSNLHVFLVSLMICAGCSVKENRSLCPCMLVLDFSEVDTSVVRSADLVMAADDGYLFTDRFEIEDFRSEMVLSVPRKTMAMGLWSGAEGMTNYKGLRISEGDDCPPVYFHASEIDTRCETMREKVLMRKNHCKMTVNLIHSNASAWGIHVFGNVDGYLPDGTPSEGGFSYELDKMGDGSFMVVLPRQTDNSLTMELDDGSGVMKRFNLGDYIAESGYDWTAADLEDLVIDIDIVFTSMVLTIREWDSLDKFDVVI